MEWIYDEYSVVEKHAQTMLQLVKFCIDWKCGELEQIVNIPVTQFVEEIAELNIPFTQIVEEITESNIPVPQIVEEIAEVSKFSIDLTVVHLSHQFGFRDATLWCWKCGGWSAGSRRASRLKDPCGFPSKTGADVVYRVSGGYPPKAHVWRSDDVSGAPERIPIIKTLTATDSGHSLSIKTTTQSDLSLPVSTCSGCGVLGPSTSITLPQGALSSTKVPLLVRAETEDSLNIWNSLWSITVSEVRCSVFSLTRNWTRWL